MRSIFRPGTPVAIRLIFTVPAAVAFMWIDMAFLAQSPVAPWIGVLISVVVGYGAFLAIGAAAAEGGWRQRLRVVLIATFLYASLTFASTWMAGTANANKIFAVQAMLALVATVTMTRRPRFAFGVLILLAGTGLLLAVNMLIQAISGALPPSVTAIYAYLEAATFAGLWLGRRLIKAPAVEPAPAEAIGR